MFCYQKNFSNPTLPVDEAQFYALVRATQWNENIDRYRETHDAALKRKLPAFIFQATFDDTTSKSGKTGAWRKQAATRLTGLVVMDVDHVKNPHEVHGEWLKVHGDLKKLGILLVYITPSGEGLKIVFKARQEWGNLIDNQHEMAKLLGVEVDESCKDASRMSFICKEKDILYIDKELFTYENKEFAERYDAVYRDGQSAPSNLPLQGEAKSADETLLSFKDIPYSSIIQEYWNRTDGEPQEGERNVKLYQLAVNLRAICDNKREVLMKVMPRYGLSEQELQSIVDSACKEPPKGISKLMQRILDELRRYEGTEVWGCEDSSGAEDNGQCSMVNVQCPKLPLGLKESLIGVPASMHMPVLCGVLPIAAAYADQVEVEYCDGNRQHLGLMSIIRGEQASGKSVVKGAVDVWKRQFDEEDALARKREDEWKERKKGRKANEKAPEDPKVLIRMVPVTVSCSTLLKRFKNAQGHTLYSFGEELDTLRKTNGAGSWSSKYDIYRLAFDQGEWGQDYNSDAAESGVVKVAYNWTMLGTNGALKKCFRADNIENGLSSRILVAEMPDSSFSKMPKFKHRSTEDEGKILEAVTRLRSYSGYVDTPRLRKAIEEWVEEKRVEAAKDIDHVKDTYRKRAAVIGFRCGVVYRLLEGKESKACLEFAVMMAEYCLEQQISAFGEALRTECINARDECRRYGCNNSIFDQLPPIFTADDIVALKPSGVTRNSIIKTISRWNRDGWITKVDVKRWGKVNRDNDKVTS